jgi:hypothetical protein
MRCSRPDKAQNAFRNLGAEMRAFANEEPSRQWSGKSLRCDADEIASALVAYSNQIRHPASFDLLLIGTFKSCCAYSESASI